MVASGLRSLGWATETLELRALDREYRAHLEPPEQDAEPFRVAATMFWRWGALETARAQTCEEDVLREMLGVDAVDERDTEQPCLRLDVEMHAHMPYGKRSAEPISERLRGGGAWHTSTAKVLDNAIVGYVLARRAEIDVEIG